MHAHIGDLVFVVPGQWTPEEYESVHGNPEVKKLINEYRDTLPEGAYER